MRHPYYDEYIYETKEGRPEIDILKYDPYYIGITIIAWNQYGQVSWEGPKLFSPDLSSIPQVLELCKIVLILDKIFQKLKSYKKLS